MKILSVKTLKYYTLYNNVSEYQLLEDLNLPDPDDSPTPEECYKKQCENTRAILSHYRSQGFTHLHDHEKNTLVSL